MKTRLIQSAFIASILLFVRVAESGRGRGNNDWTLWHWVMTGLAVYATLVGFSFRRKLLRRSEEALAKDASNPRALKQWQAGQFLGFAFAENIAIWGVLVRMVLGGALWQASLFYGAALFLLLLWTPRMPITTPAST